MMGVIGVRFCGVGTIETYSAGEEQLRRGDHVPYGIQYGVEYGTAILGNHTLCSRKEENPPQAIPGRTTGGDVVWAAVYKNKEREVLLFCWKKVEMLGLDVKIISVVFPLRDDKVLLFFSTDTRVDFRILVKELGVQHQRRTEPRQVDARDETRLLGGMGDCERLLCYHAYLSEFMPVSIKVTKEQELVLNPRKIGGAYGRFICCLKHEIDTYAGPNKMLPREGDSVQLPDGVRGSAVEVSVLKQILRVACYAGGEKELWDAAVTGTTIIECRRKGMPLTQKRAVDVQCEKKTGKTAVKQCEGKEKPGKRNGAPQQERTREKKE